MVVGRCSVQSAPQGFEIGGFVRVDGEVGRLGCVEFLDDVPAGGFNRLVHCGDEVGRGPIFFVAGDEEHAVRQEEGGGGSDQGGQVFLDAKDAAGFGTGKGGRIEQDEVEPAVPALEAA